MEKSEKLYFIFVSIAGLLFVGFVCLLWSGYLNESCDCGIIVDKVCVPQRTRLMPMAKSLMPMKVKTKYFLCVRDSQLRYHKVEVDVYTYNAAMIGGEYRADDEI